VIPTLVVDEDGNVLERHQVVKLLEEAELDADLTTQPDPWSFCEAGAEVS